jgi:outer membrane protein assembly factor BamB
MDLRQAALTLSVLFCLPASQRVGAAPDAPAWSRFRGPDGAGVALASDVPSVWTRDDCRWIATLPGRGHSSPVGWGPQVFVTGVDPATSARLLAAIDVATGGVRWTVRHEQAPPPLHAFNSAASSSPAVDARHVYVLWAAADDVTLVAYAHDGRFAWSQRLGPFQERHGPGASPVAIDDLVVVAHDHEGESHVSAFAAADGAVRWRTPRKSGTSAYATPAVRTAADGTRQVVVQSTAEGMAGLDLADGRVVWQAPDAFPVRCVSSPVLAGDAVLGCCGEGGTGKRLVCVRPGANPADPPALVYELRKNIPQSPTVVVLGDLLFSWQDRGVVTCLDASTGEEHWNERVGGRYFGSPIAVGDKLIGVSDAGEAVTLAARRNYQLLGRVPLEETSHATPAVHGGMLLIRTETRLHALPLRTAPAAAER